MKKVLSLFLVSYLFLVILVSCKQVNNSPSKELISEISLKKGPVISCSPIGEQFGTADFETSCSDNVRDDFNLAVKLLHSFEYDEAEKAFAKVIEKEPGCAMAYWGVAMSNFHPLWTPPTEAELIKGTKAIEIAQSLKTTKREADYIAAIAAFYKDWIVVDHSTRALRFEKGMANVYANYPDDKEAAVFYALALNAAADPNDKSFVKQKKAGSILQELYALNPNHPGVVHYLIHSYDYPELAQHGLAAAKIYASVAPSSAHALHMPSHIFTRLGMWDECIKSNLASVYSAQCYAKAAAMKGHWDEELHGMDYLMYAYLQKGENDSAKKQWEYLRTIDEVYPQNLKVAYAYAAIPSRYVLENKLWQEAASLEVLPKNFPWEKHPWPKAIIHFSRLMGAVNIGSLQNAKNELNEMHHLHTILLNKKDTYPANQVAIQVKAAEAWIAMKEGKHEQAQALMHLAADMEDKTEKHPATPGEVMPARELLGDMLLQMNQPEKALAAYEADLKKRPNRLNALYGAGLAAEALGDRQQAKKYFQQLVQVVGNTKSNRLEVNKSKQYSKELASL